MTPTSPDSRSLSNPDRNIGRLARRLCIVARNHPLLFGYLSTLFRDRPIGSEQIELVIDRRHPESPRPPDVERRRPSEIDEELRRRGFAFVGPTTMYALMQAVGVVNDHLAGCPARMGVEALRR